MEAERGHHERPRTDGEDRKEDRGHAHKTSRSSPPSFRNEAAASSGGRESRPEPSRGSPPPSEASSKKLRLESPGGPLPTASEVTIIGSVTKQPKKKEKGKKPVTRNSLVITRDWLPSRHWQIRDGRLTYQPFQEAIFECSTTLKAERAWSRTLSFPLKPVSLVDSLTDPSKLPVPLGKNDILKELAKNPAMMLLPRPRFDGCHSGRCSCVVHGMKDVHHRTSVLHDVCLRDGSLAERDLAVESKFKNFVENPSHFYFWNESKKDHLLAVPQPFRNGGSWTPVPFSPTLSDCSDRLAAQLYLSIYNREKAKTMANIYMSPPSEWEAATHPCLSEPPVGSELWRQSHLLYGVESVHRVNYCHHPLAEDFFYLFLAADYESLQVPVIRRDPAIPNLSDQIIGRLLEPFWRYGCGKVLCSVCLADVINGEFQPVFLTRNEFLQHWVEQHLSSLVAVTTFSATSLNSRLYQGHTIYLLACNVSYSEDLRDSPHLIPTDYTGISVQLTFSKVLSNAISRPAGLPVAASVPLPGPCQQVSSAASVPFPGPSQQVSSAAAVPFPGPSQQVPSAPGLQSSVSSGSSLQIPSDLTFPSVHAASFAASFTPDADAESLLDADDGTPDADAEGLLDADDETLLDNMDTDDHQSFPTPAEAYRKQPVNSDADAAKKAKKKAKKK
jgi:hypothetical protein